ncbi:MAG: hypothetical protein H6707_04575 [Deltaproteobacteria bacterium]|nr:hypothetical protein [Deltaproteobacteria bacterium]
MRGRVMALIPVALLFLVAAKQQSAGCGGGDTCTYDGATYGDGETFAATDGCNSCSCSAGRVRCTLRACPKTCTVDGRTYADGASFPAADGCNTCVCNDGQVGCTEKACPPIGCTFNGQLYAHGASFPASDGCNTCMCNNGLVGCTKIACTVERCGGIVGLRCRDTSDYCNYQGGHCGVADQMGVCEPRPQTCTAQFDPVCGCNGVTFSNACRAAAAGVSVQHAGPC